MDPSSLLEALAAAVEAGLVAKKVYDRMRRALDDHGTVQAADFSGITRGSSSTAPSSAPSSSDETTWSDALQNRRRRHARGCACERCREAMRKRRELDDDVAAMFGG